MTTNKKPDTHQISALLNMSRSRLLVKVSLLILAGFCVRISLGCREREPQDMIYNHISLKGIDNSGDFYKYSDSLFSDAVAIELTLKDTTYMYSSVPNRINEGLSFHSAQAFSYVQTFQPVNKVQTIKVFSLYDLNGSTLAGADITDSVLYAFRDRFDLYHTEDAAKDLINGIQHEEGPSLHMILKPAVLNTRAQFRVEVSFDDGSLLTATTHLFTIKPSEL